MAIGHSDEHGDDDGEHGEGTRRWRYRGRVRRIKREDVNRRGYVYGYNKYGKRYRGKRRNNYRMEENDGNGGHGSNGGHDNNGGNGGNGGHGGGNGGNGGNGHSSNGEN